MTCIFPGKENERSPAENQTPGGGTGEDPKQLFWERGVETV